MRCVCVCPLRWIPWFLLPSDGCSAAGLAVHRINNHGEKRQRPSSSPEWTEPWGSVWLTRSHPATVCSHFVCVCLFCGRSGCSAPLLQQDAGSAVCSRVCVVPSWQETPQQAVCWANVGLYLFGDRVESVLRGYLHFDFSFSSNLSGGWQKNSHSVLKWKYLCKKV